jgi:hypothetical protein
MAAERRILCLLLFALRTSGLGVIHRWFLPLPLLFCSGLAHRACFLVLLYSSPYLPVTGGGSLLNVVACSAISYGWHWRMGGGPSPACLVAGW